MGDFIPRGSDFSRVPIHTTLFVPGETESESADARTLFQGIADTTLGRFREPYPPLPPTPAPTAAPGYYFGECRPFCIDMLDCEMFPLLCGGCHVCGYEASMCDISCNRMSDCLFHSGPCAGCSFCF